MKVTISDAIRYIGVDDTTIDLFESQYPVPTGVSYNSYVILDEKTAVLDTVDARATWMPSFSGTSVHASYNFYFCDDLEDVADVITSILYDVSRRALSYISGRPTHLR